MAENAPTNGMNEIENSLKVINSLSSSDIASRYSKWKESVLSGTPIEKLSLEVKQLIGGCLFMTMRFKGGSFYRARKNFKNRMFINTSELWYPPSASINKLGRANPIGVPMLYICQDGRTALFETQVKPGEHVMIAELKIKDGHSLNLQEVGVIDYLQLDQFRGFDSLRIEKFKSIGCTDRGIENVFTIHRILREEFMIDVPQGCEQLYSVSVAITNFLLTFNNADGIIYPSLRSRNDYNIALKSSVADNSVQVTRIDGVLIDGSSSDTIEFRHLVTSKEILPDGRILWTDKISGLNWAPIGTNLA
jgi:RES domain-containing protein